MMDMLVRLYDLPDIDDEVQVLKERGILIRRPGAYERHLVADWVGRHFSPKWVSETKTAFARQPISCFIATREKQMIGFACYDVTARGFLGPMGVGEEARKSGVGPADFYARTVGAVPIEGSSPGIYVDILPEPQA